MGQPVDTNQANAFLKAAEALGFHQPHFNFAVNQVSVDGCVEEQVRIWRGGKSKTYKQDSAGRFLREALIDLHAGYFGVVGDYEHAECTAVQLAGGTFAGMWIADAFIAETNGTLIEMEGPRLFPNEAEALHAARDWLQAQLRNRGEAR